jgi:hypothetical protein
MLDGADTLHDHSDLSAALLRFRAAVTTVRWLLAADSQSGVNWHRVGTEYPNPSIGSNYFIDGIGAGIEEVL